jgi:long-chain fatty acid transport protein
VIARTTLIAAALLLAATTARAGGFAVPETAASTGGVAGAATARTDDPAAAWYDPAALVDGGGWRLGVGMMLPMSSLEARAADGSWTAHTTGAPTPVPQIFATRSAGAWAIGLAVTVPYGGDVAWPTDWPGRHEIVSSKLIDVRIAPFIGWRTGRLRVAGGVHVDLGKLDLDRGLDFIDTDGTVLLALHGVGVGVDAAAYVDVGAGIAVGASYKSRTSMALKGDANFTAPDAFSMKTPDQHVSSRLALPDRLALGASIQRGPWRGFGDVELTTWSVNKQQVIDFAQPQTPDVTQVNDWHTTIGAKVGGEWSRGHGTVRAGLAWDPTPAGTGHLAPTTPDGNRVAITLGGGWQLGKGVAADAFYGYLHIGERASTNPDSMMASYGGHAHLLGLGLRVTR